MSIVATIVIAAVLALAFVAALRYSMTHNVTCAECTGNDPQCTLGKCAPIIHEEYRQQSLEDLWNEQTSGK